MEEKELFKKIEKASEEFTETNFKKPSEQDYITVENAMLVGARIALEREVTSEQIRNMARREK